MSVCCSRRIIIISRAIMSSHDSTQRHDDVLQQLSAAVKEAGGTTHIQPRYMMADGSGRSDLKSHSLRPDARFDTPRGDRLCDVSIICPDAATYVGAGQKVGGAALRRECAKQKKYAAIVAREGVPMVAFVIEAHGCWGKEAKDYLAFLGGLAEATYHGPSAAEFIRRHRFLISLAVVRGNARLATSCGGLLQRRALLQ